MTAATRSRHEAGISLVEVLVSMTVLALALVSLAPLMLTVQRRSQANNNVAFRNAVVANRARRLSAISFSTMSPGTTCDSTTAQPFPYHACTTIVRDSTNRNTLTVIVTPDVYPTLKADTITFDRANIVVYNPMNY